MTKKSTLLTTAAMVLCLGTSGVQASSNQENPLSLKSMARAGIIAALSLGQVDGFKTPGRLVAKPISKGTELKGFKEDAENFIATKFLGKPTDVQLEFDPGLDYWAKRAVLNKLASAFFESGESLGSKFSPLVNDAEDLVDWREFGLPVSKVYTSRNTPNSEKSLTKQLVSAALYQINRLRPFDGNLPQIPSNPRQILELSYPAEYAKLFPAPFYPPILKNNQNNLVGALALEGPFAAYIQRDTNNGQYFIDFSDFEHYPVKNGLYNLGGKAFFNYDENAKQMKISSFHYKGKSYTSDSPEFKTIQKIVLSTMSTDTAFFRHLLDTHMIVAGTFCALNNKYLGVSHPLRVLMHPFQDQTLGVNDYEIKTLIGNEYQFVPTVSSYDVNTLKKIFADKRDSFDIAQMDIRESLQRRAMDKASVKYPYAENTGRLFSIISGFVSEYVDQYYGKYSSDNEFVKNENEIVEWYKALDKYIPNGIDSYAGELNRESLKKLISLFIYTASVEHKNISGLPYNFSAWFQDIPITVRLDGKRPHIGHQQFFTNILFATNVPTPTLVDDISQFALDDSGREIMQSFTKAMRDYQAELDAQGPDKNRTRLDPKDIDTSVSS